MFFQIVHDRENHAYYRNSSTEVKSIPGYSALIVSWGFEPTTFWLPIQNFNKYSTSLTIQITSTEGKSN